MDPGAFACEIGTVASGLNPKRSRAKLPAGGARIIAFPSFDDYRHEVLGWLADLERGGTATLAIAFGKAYTRLRVVRNSRRHLLLAEFIHHAILALESGECDGARCILLTAMASLGWSSKYGDARKLH